MYTLMLHTEISDEKVIIQLKEKVKQDVGMCISKPVFFTFQIITKPVFYCAKN